MWALAMLVAAPQLAQAQDADVDEVVAEYSRDFAARLKAETAAAKKPMIDALIAGQFDEAEAQALIWLKAQSWFKPPAKDKLIKQQRTALGIAMSEAILEAALASDPAQADRLADIGLRFAREREGKPLPANITAAQVTEGIVLSEVEPLLAADPVDMARLELIMRAATAATERRAGPDSPEIAEGLMVLGGAMSKQGKLDAARPVIERAIAIQIKAKGEADETTLSYQNELARNHSARGDESAALALYEQLSATALKTFGAEDNRTLKARNNVAVAMIKMSRFGEAEPVLREIYEARLKLFGADHAAVRRSALNLADVLIELGRFAEAEPYAEQASFGADSDERDDKEDRAEAAAMMANVREEQGRMDDSIALRRQALDITDQLWGSNAPETLLAVNNLAVALNQAGLLAEAEPLLRRTLAFDRATYGEDHPGTGLSWSNLASTIDALGKREEAAEAYKTGIAILEKQKLPDVEALASAYRNYGLFLDEEDKIGESLSYVRKALDLEISIVGPDHPRVAGLRSNLASLLSASAQPDKAIELWRAGLASLQGRVPNSNGNLVRIKFLLASTLMYQEGGLDEAYGLAREAVTTMRTGLLDSVDRAGGKRSFGNETPFGVLLRAAWLKHGVQKEGDTLYLDDAFQAAQDLTLGPSSTAMVQAAARAAAGEGPLAELVRRKQDYEAKRRKADAELIAAFGKARTTRPETYQASLTAIEKELATLNAQIDARFPAYRALTSPAPLALADVQKALADDEALLLIVPTHGDVYSFAVTKGGSTWHQAEGMDDELRGDLANLRCQVDPHTCSTDTENRLMELEQSDKAQAGFRPFDVEAAHHLYRELIAPVEATLLGKTRLYVVSTGAYGDLPLSMLARQPVADSADMADPEVLKGVDWMADHYAMTRLTSVAALRLPAPARKVIEKQSFSGYGAPSLSGDALAPVRGASVFRSGPDGDGIVRTVADPAVLRTLSSLPGTQTELQAMATSLGVGSETLHLGGAATEANFRADPRVAKAGILAFATHGLLPGEASSANEPGLVMTPPETADWQNDGVLTASEVSQMSLVAEWVILSACNTASPQGDKGADSLSGLARGFLYAGAQALLATHWRVSDDATAALTVETLRVRRTQPGVTRAQALQAAMHAVRTGKRSDGSAVAGWTADWAHPAAWAPFSHISNRDN
jgi:CHAT domain-containing protein